MIKLSDMSEDDIISVVELCADSSPWSADSLRGELANANAFNLIASIGGEVVGFLNSHIICGEGAINNLSVRQNYRKQGVATALVLSLLERAGACKADFFTLEVRESNNTAIAFYEKMGFVKLGIRKGFYENPTENAIIYKIEI